MRGFTLVEVLVAMLVFGILASAGAAVMRTSIDSQSQMRERMDRLAEFQRLRATLKADLSQAAPRRTRDMDGVRSRAAFVGADGGSPMLALVRRGWENPDHRSRPSMQYVEYRLENGRLERQVRPALDGAPLLAPQVLYDGVEEAHVAFYARRQWLSAWSEPNALPDVVRLDLRLKELGTVSQLFLTPGTGL